MDAGFKRNVKYLSLMQVKFLGWICAFGCIYGLLMAFMNGGSAAEMKQSGGQYFILLLLITPMSLQMRYVRNIAGFVLSMGCTRKNIMIGQHILSLEIFAESILLFALVRLVFGAGDVGDAAYFCYYAAGITAMLAVGVFGGFVLSRGTAAGVVLYVVFAGVAVGGIIGALVMASVLTSGSGEAWINGGWNSQALFFAAWLAALAVYVIASFFTAGKFRKMEVKC